VFPQSHSALRLSLQWHRVVVAGEINGLNSPYDRGLLAGASALLTARKQGRISKKTRLSDFTAAIGRVFFCKKLAKEYVQCIIYSENIY